MNRQILLWAAKRRRQDLLKKLDEAFDPRVSRELDAVDALIETLEA